MTDSMIERVARAILRNIYESGGHNPPSWEGADKWQRGACLSNARAAIEAMREPTEAMNDAGEKPFDEPFVGGRLTPAYAVWEAMIDAALATDSADAGHVRA